MTDRVWITKYALTTGIHETDADIQGPNAVVGKQKIYYNKNEWRWTREDAVKRAEEMRVKEIARLEKKLARLKNLKIKVKNFD